MKRYIYAVMAVATLLGSCSRQTQPGFAIVIDPESYKEARTEIELYQETVASRGLYPVLLIDEWGVPDSIRQKLIELHNDSQHPIEGCVLIGDIPVAMVRDAQHMASAFKMDQEAFPRFESHIPTDRFYDSFDLKFKYLDKDSTRWFYYTLEADGAQKLEPTIYSARITPRDNERGNKYEKLRRYMQRACNADAEQNQFDRILFFGGHGNLSNSLVARMDAKWEFYDQYPWMLDQKQSVTYMDYSHDEYIKPRLCDELQDPSIDYALLSHHGDATIQYLSGTDDDRSILQTFEFDNYHPQARLVSLDACYNGSFHKDDNIQEAYLFGEGNGTLLVLGNSVNSIQDKWANRYTGLLGLGMRAGYLAKYGGFLEFHLFGDPTYAFAKSGDCGFDINSAILDGDDAFWTKQLDNKYPAVQSLAAHLLAAGGTDGSSSAIAKRFKSSDCGMVRLACLMELTAYRNNDFQECLRLALNDEFEPTQRFAVIYAGKYGNPDLMPDLAELLCQNHLTERVEFDLDISMRCFDSTLVFDAVDKAFKETTYHSNPDSILGLLHTSLAGYAGSLPFDIREYIAKPDAPQRGTLLAISILRNNPAHFILPELLPWLDDSKADSTVQKAAWEALGWFWMSYRHQDIADQALKVSQDESFPASVRAEALKTYNRVK